MKEMLKEVRERKGGFTMAELLIVVAIVAVLVAIAIPVFSSQLERSKESTDLANIRVAYAEATAEALTTGADASKVSVPMTQADAGWDKVTDATIGDYSTASGAAKAMPSVKKGDTVTVTVTASSGAVTIAKTS